MVIIWGRALRRGVGCLVLLLFVLWLSPAGAAGVSATALAVVVDDRAYGIAYDGWAGVADGQASGGGYRAAGAAGQRISYRNPVPTTTAPNWTAESNQAEADYGHTLATAGDVNGDGYDDVIVGAPYYDNGLSDEGAAFVYHGSAAGLSLVANWTAESDQTDAQFGRSVAAAGDVNGDGYDDVIVGAWLYDNGQTDEGRAFVYHGSASGLSLTANWTAESDQASSRYTHPLAGAGDVNGDGYDDVIVGADWYDNGQTDEGAAFVYHGSADGLSPSANWTAESDQADAAFGTPVATAGDANRDGYDDVIVGAHAYDNGEVNEGRAFVYHGSAAGLSPSADWMGESNQTGGTFGWAVGRAGDVNGDGFDDVIVGAEHYDNGEVDEGRAFVFHGAIAGLSPSPNWTAESNQADSGFTHASATVGDVNSDGYDDVIVGAPYYENGQMDEGRAFVYYGSAAGLSATANWTAESNQEAAWYGRSAGTAGDVNGDGTDDVIVAAMDYDNGQTNEGRAFVYHGSAGGPGTMPMTVVTYHGPDQGLARLVIDGQSQGVFDLYAAAPDYQVRVTIANVPSGRHTTMVVALGQKNPASTGTEVRVDGFETPDGLTEETSSLVRYHGWAGLAAAEAYEGGARWSDQQGATVSFTFTGTQFSWITTLGPAMGLAEVWVDGALVSTVDLYNPTVAWQVLIPVGGLSIGPHLVEIRVLGTHNPASTGDKVVFDGYGAP